MKLGGSVHQSCAARGIELEGGRVAGVVTEAGTIRTRIAVLAGGAWASSFCRQLGIRFPQAAVRSSILAVAPGGKDCRTRSTPRASRVTRRGDGGYTLADQRPRARRSDAAADPLRPPVPADVRPALAQSRPGRPGRHSRGPRDPRPLARSTGRRRWSACASSIPARRRRCIRETLARARELLPALARSRQSPPHGRAISTARRTACPAIGETAIPRFILAAGFSGHGFGIGPGAGHLIADIVTGAPPIVDPAPYAPAASTAAPGARSWTSDYCRRLALHGSTGMRGLLARRSPVVGRTGKKSTERWLANP